MKKSTPSPESPKIHARPVERSTDFALEDAIRVASSKRSDTEKVNGFLHLAAKIQDEAEARHLRDETIRILGPRYQEHWVQEILAVLNDTIHRTRAEVRTVAKGHVRQGTRRKTEDSVTSIRLSDVSDVGLQDALNDLRGALREEPKVTAGQAFENFLDLVVRARHEHDDGRHILVIKKEVMRQFSSKLQKTQLVQDVLRLLDDELAEMSKKAASSAARRAA